MGNKLSKLIQNKIDDIIIHNLNCRIRSIKCIKYLVTLNEDFLDAFCYVQNYIDINVDIYNNNIIDLLVNKKKYKEIEYICNMKKIIPTVYNVTKVPFNIFCIIVRHLSTDKVIIYLDWVLHYGCWRKAFYLIKKYNLFDQNHKISFTQNVQNSKNNQIFIRNQGGKNKKYVAKILKLLFQISKSVFILEI
jgi:hypothetical protein